MHPRERALRFLDSDFEAFYPWVGESYEPGGLLLVGESHFDKRYPYERSPSEAERFETIDLIAGRSTWTRDDEKRFVLRGESFLDQLDIVGNPKGDPWQHISFCNFCNKYMPFSSGKRHEPSEETLEASIKPFRQIAEAVQPRWIVVSSYLAFDRLMNFSVIEKKLLPAGNSRAEKARIDFNFEHDIFPTMHFSRSSATEAANRIRQLMLENYP